MAKVYRWETDEEGHRVAIIRPDELMDLSTLQKRHNPNPLRRKWYAVNRVTGGEEPYAHNLGQAHPDWLRQNPDHYEKMAALIPAPYAEADDQNLERLRRGAAPAR